MPLGNEDKWEMNEDDSHLRNAVARSPKVLRYSLSDVCPHFPCEKRGNFYQASSSISFVITLISCNQSSPEYLYLNCLPNLRAESARQLIPPPVAAPCPHPPPVSFRLVSSSIQPPSATAACKLTNPPTQLAVHLAKRSYASG